MIQLYQFQTTSYLCMEKNRYQDRVSPIETQWFESPSESTKGSDRINLVKDQTCTHMHEYLALWENKHIKQMDKRKYCVCDYGFLHHARKDNEVPSWIGKFSRAKMVPTALLEQHCDYLPVENTVDTSYNSYC